MKKVVPLIGLFAALVTIAIQPINSGSGPGAAWALTGLAMAAVGTVIGSMTNRRAGRAAASSGLIGGAILIVAAAILV